jgi:hypothetical protein
MSFTIFNQDLAFEVRSKVKLKSFSTKSLRLLQEANEHRQKIAQLTMPLSLRSLDQHRKKLVNAIQKQDSQTFKHYLNEYLLDQKNYQQHDHYLKTARWLNSDVWQGWEIAQDQHKRQIKKLHKFWQQNQHTNHFTSDAIYIAAHHTLAVFENFHQLATVEIKSYAAKLTPPLYHKLKQHLVKMADEIRSEQILLCDAMLSRLTVASSYGNLQADDVTEFVIKNLQRVGIDSHGDIDGARNDLRPDIFRYFHHFICTKGTLAQNKKLAKLNWFVPNEHYYTQKVDNGLIVVPQKFKKFRIPTTTSKFDWLFKWQNFRANFFKNKFYQIAAIRLLDKDAMSHQGLIDLLQGSKLQQLNSLESELCDEVRQAKNTTDSFWLRIFHPAKQEFMQLWQAYAEQALETVLDCKIQHCALLAEQLRTRCVLGLDLELVTALETKEKIKKIIDGIETLLIRCNRSPDYYPSWSRSKLVLYEAIRKTSVKNAGSCSSSSVTIMTHLQNANRVNDTQVNVLEKMRDVLKNILVQDYFDPSLTDFVVYVSELNALAQQVQHPSEELSVFWRQMFVSYVKTSLICSDHPNMITLLQLIKNHANSSIQYSAASLMQCKNSGGSLYQMKCRALLFSYERNLVKPNSQLSLDENELTDLTINKGAA